MRWPEFTDDFLKKLPGEPALREGVRQVDGVWVSVLPTATAQPQLLAVSQDMLQVLGLDEDPSRHPAFARLFGGSALLEGLQPYASNYGGHQFGHWAGQLGDGRAMTLGTALARNGEALELQLKGAGPTPFSRHADGRAVLRSSIREFICSEAMHHLGIPTTRALSLVATGDEVLRDVLYDGHPAPEPGAVVCRVAKSFLRFGHFELPSARGDIALLRALMQATIERYFPQISSTLPLEAQVAELFEEICTSTAQLIAHWQRVGFVHGVMNTDNMSILGLTIDYGPYGWLDAFDPNFTPNTTDAQHRRYRYGWQPRIAYWNLGALARALSPLVRDAAALQAGLDAFTSTYTRCDLANAAAKLGLVDEVRALELLREAYPLMADAELDHTLFFRSLMAYALNDASLDAFTPAVYSQDRFAAATPALVAWLQKYAAQVAEEGRAPDVRLQAMAEANPLYIPRNWLAAEVIEAATAGDLQPLHAWMEVLRNPYTHQPGAEHYALKRPDWARDKVGCSMLSCSS